MQLERQPRLVLPPQAVNLAEHVCAVPEDSPCAVFDNIASRSKLPLVPSGVDPGYESSSVDSTTEVEYATLEARLCQTGLSLVMSIRPTSVVAQARVAEEAEELRRVRCKQIEASATERARRDADAIFWRAELGLS